MIETAYLVANGDQRLSANQTCWPAQQEFERLLGAAFAVARRDGGPGAPRRHRRRARVHLQPGRGSPGARRHPARRAARRGGGGVAVLPAGARRAAARIAARSSPSPTGRAQWPGLVGLLNLNASLDQGGPGVRHGVEQDLRRRLVRRQARPLAGRQAARARRTPRAPVRPCPGVRPEARAAADSVVSTPAARRRDPRRLRRGLHGDVQRDHPGRAAVPAQRVQGAPLPVGAVRRDDGGPRGRRPRSLRLAAREGDDLPLRHGRGHRAHRAPGAAAAADVRRRSRGWPTGSAST